MGVEKDPKRFEREVADVVDRWAAEGKRLQPQFIANEIIQNHEGGLARQNDDVDFLRHYTFKGVRQSVGAYISKKFGDTRADRESIAAILPGFEYVQTHYVIGSGDDAEGVPVETMSDDDIDARAQLLMRRGDSLHAHADELLRFKRLRGQNRAA
ncbi:MAG: hypothetical protein NVS3B5_02270 [Sphingomicrobium sp.]